MSNTNSTQQTDREKAKKYFDNLSRIEVKALIQKYYPNALQVTGSMYLEIWRKETYPTTTDNGGELKPEDRFRRLLEHIRDEIKSIDNDTPYSVIPPKWWESMSNLQSHCCGFLNGERINYTMQDGRQF